MALSQEYDLIVPLMSLSSKQAMIAFWMHHIEMLHNCYTPELMICKVQRPICLVKLRVLLTSQLSGGRDGALRKHQEKEDCHCQSCVWRWSGHHWFNNAEEGGCICPMLARPIVQHLIKADLESSHREVGPISRREVAARAGVLQPTCKPLSWKHQNRNVSVGCKRRQALWARAHSYWTHSQCKRQIHGNSSSISHLFTMEGSIYLMATSH